MSVTEPEPEPEPAHTTVSRATAISWHPTSRRHAHARVAGEIRPTLASVRT